MPLTLFFGQETDSLSSDSHSLTLGALKQAQELKNYHPRQRESSANPSFAKTMEDKLLEAKVWGCFFSGIVLRDDVPGGSRTPA